MAARDGQAGGPWHSMSSEDGLRLASSLAIALCWQRSAPATRREADGAPEETLDIVFDGLSSREQEIAVRSFPGGRRFRLGAAPLTPTES